MNYALNVTKIRLLFFHRSCDINGLQVYFHLQKRAKKVLRKINKIYIIKIFSKLLSE